MITNYQVVLKGVGVGYLREDVAEKLAPLFKISIDEADQMLDQHDLVVKNGIDFQAAVKYVEALENCGCFCEVQPEPAHTTESTAAAQPALNCLNERHERFNSVNEEPFSESTRIDEENKWFYPKVGGRGKKFALYGLIGSVLIASVGYGSIRVYEAREKRLTAEKEKLALVKLASIKPSTFDAVKLKAIYPAEKSDVLDWSKFNPKSEIVRNILTALQAKDYATLASIPEIDQILSSNYPWGASTEPPEEEYNARRELFQMIENQPALALEFAEPSKSSAPYLYESWLEVAFQNGSKKALNTYIDIQNKKRAYADLVSLFIGRNGVTVDFPKAAEYFGLAIQSGDSQIGNDDWIVDKILSNGPKVASAAREGQLFGADSPPIGNPDDLLKGCNKSSKDIIDPINNGQGVYENQASSDAARLCKSALFFNKNNKDIWYQYGFAHQRNQQWVMAKIAYARSAELGNPMAIARFWWIEFPANQKRAVEMLQAEARNGNPWGDYFLGKVYGGSFKEALDYKKAERGYLKAIDAGITYAYLDLAEMYLEQKQYDLAVKSWEKASEKFPEAALALGQAYEEGEVVKKDIKLSKSWYTKAADQGNEEAKAALARFDKEAIARSEQRASSKDSSNSEQSDLVDRCVQQALNTGYGDGQCAYSFINACVTTQSRSEMERAFAIDRMVGMNSGGGCVNMPTNYVNAFNKAAGNRDRF